MKKIGIFSGAFDPVHKGHVAFALAAVEAAGLSKVYFAPEAKPRRKPGVTHISHRLAMLKLATRAHPKLDVIELPDKYFLSTTTLPRITKLFPESDLHILIGSDHLVHMPYWPRVDYLLKNTGLVIGVRGHDDVADTLERIMNLPTQPKSIHVVDSPEPDLASGKVREQLRNHSPSKEILPSVQAYAKKHWLYVDVGRN